MLHSATPTAEGDDSTLRVESYQELVNAVLYLVTQGEESGNIRFYNYPDAQVEEDLSAACLEIAHEDPLGAYCVDYIRTSKLTPIVSYYEAELQIAYRRTPEQVASVVAATGASAIRAELQEALIDFPNEVVLRIGYMDGDEAYIADLIEQAYYAAPSAALDYPEHQVYLYPHTGNQRIVEVILTYHEPVERLKEKQRELMGRAEELVQQVWAELPRDTQILELANLLYQQTAFQPDGGDTAYDALIGGGGNSQGAALAMLLLCQAREIGATCVRGTYEGRPHAWIIVQTQLGYRHFDLTHMTERLGGDDTTLFLSDRQMTEMGYEWDTITAPRCGE